MVKQLMRQDGTWNETLIRTHFSIETPEAILQTAIRRAEDKNHLAEGKEWLVLYEVRILNDFQIFSSPNRCTTKPFQKQRHVEVSLVFTSSTKSESLCLEIDT